MNKKFLLVPSLISICACLCACSEQSVTIKEGTYYLSNGKNDTYIVISNVTDEKSQNSLDIGEYTGKCDIQFYNYDFTQDSEQCATLAAMMEQTGRFDGDCTDEQFDELKEKYMELIDLNKQLSENKGDANLGKQDDSYYITIVVDGTVSEYDEWGRELVMEYYPSENSIVFNEYKFVLGCI